MDSKLEQLLKGQESFGTRIVALEKANQEQDLKIANIESFVKDVDRNGTSGLKELAQKVASNGTRIEAFSDHGSPGEHTRAMERQDRLAKVERELTLHIAEGKRP